MQKSPQRSIELDFFRGLVLLVIVVDHVGGSILSRFTLHSYAFNDAAEVFVFLGGYAAATAYLSLNARHGTFAAIGRFARRAFEIYRAFLVTAGLMLAISSVLHACGVTAPNVADEDVKNLLEAPLQTLVEILLLERQPYLASVLPMYVGFALMVPLATPLARRQPWLLACASIAAWAGAALASDWLPMADDGSWDFNPFAWQLMFTLGILARCQPIYRTIKAHRIGRHASLAAAFVVATLACAKLAGFGSDADFAGKPDLGWLRVANFVAIAWLATDLVHAGWIARAARKLTWINAIGRDGLVCFVAGTAISLVVDSVLYRVTDGLLHVPFGLVADVVAIAALIAVVRARAAYLSRVSPVRVVPS